jgi:hypothetical protein
MTRAVMGTGSVSRDSELFYADPDPDIDLFGQTNGLDQRQFNYISR